jgi:5-methylcytosine-specific restriction protein A
MASRRIYETLRVSDPRYNSTRWRKMRLFQLRKDPLCAKCLQGECQHDRKIWARTRPDGSRAVCTTVATVSDHIKPHRGSALLFWDAHNLQSLCASCHSSVKQAEEMGSIYRIGEDGFPL